MTFQIIDNKQQCKNIFYKNKITNNTNLNDLKNTWSYHPSLKEYDIQYAYLYSGGKNLDECCPDYLKSSWENIKKKHLAYIKSFNVAKVRATDYCFYDLVPENFLINYFRTKSEITDHVLESYQKPNNYDFLVELSKLLYDIDQKTLNIDISEMSEELHTYKARRFKDKINKTQKNISYNLFGTVTGRLTTKKNSFPILTMDKNYRKIIKPKNDYLLELDFNAAELRCLLALNDIEQPSEDIHDWNVKNIYDNNIDRDEAKRRVFAWLYNPESEDRLLNVFYQRNKILEKYWDGEYIVNKFGRKIKTEERKSLNFVIQSTMSDCFLRRAIAVNKILEKRKSFTSALIHDSMLIDFSLEDKDLIDEIINEFGQTDLGMFKVNASIGLNFGNMKRFR